MKSALETLSPTRVKLTIEVSAEEFQPSLEQAYKLSLIHISEPTRPY